MWIRKSTSDTIVIFVHGILSDGKKCWQNKDSGIYWPHLLASEKNLEQTGIYVFTYNTGRLSSTYNIGDIVDSLWENAKLDNIFQNTKKLVFVCHCMGGVVVRRFIVKYQRYLYEKDISIGLYLVASPSLGANYDEWLTTLIECTGNTQARALRFSEQNTWLNDLDRDFQNLISATSFTIKGKELIEDKSLKKIRIEPCSAARYFKNPYKVPNSDHYSIAKPESNEAIQHRLLCKFIIDMPKKSVLFSKKLFFKYMNDQKIIIYHLDDWKLLHTEVQEFLFSILTLEDHIKLICYNKDTIKVREIARLWYASCEKKAKTIRIDFKKLKITHSLIDELLSLIKGEKYIIYCIEQFLNYNDNNSFNQILPCFYNLKDTVIELLRIADHYIKAIAEKLIIIQNGLKDE